MKITKRFVGRAALVVVILVLGVTIAGALYLKSLESSGQVPKGQLSQSVWWRVKLFGLKGRGGVPDLSWSELWKMTRHKGGFGLGKFVGSGNSLDGSVANGYDTERGP